MTLLRVRWHKHRFHSCGRPLRGKACLASATASGGRLLSHVKSRASHRFGSVKTQRWQSTALRSMAVSEMSPVRSAPRIASPMANSCEAGSPISQSAQPSLRSSSSVWKSYVVHKLISSTMQTLGTSMAPRATYLRCSAASVHLVAPSICRPATATWIFAHA